jgi:thiosulfate/3-mercaptopyruvate sulfurtransferase
MAGKNKEGAFRAGRIPWGVQVDYVLLTKKDDYVEWLPADEIQKVLKILGFNPKNQQYFYCQSGVRCSQWFITLYTMGWPIAKLHNYYSSWIGWSRNKKLPIETRCPDTTQAPWQKK